MTGEGVARERVPHRLVLVGSVIADLMTTVPALPPRGGDVLAGPIAAQAGGGFNVLAAASRLDLPSALCGLVGQGPMGVLVRAALAELAIPTLLDEPTPPTGETQPPTQMRDAAGALDVADAVDDGALDTGACLGFVEPDGERTFVTSPGIEAHLRLAHLGSVSWRPDDAVYVSGYELLYPRSGQAITDWLRDPPTVAHLVFDPGPLVADLPSARLDRVLTATTILTLNARELGLLGGDAAALLHRLAPGAVVVARDGSRGCTVWSAGAAPTAIPAPAVTPVDTTGAGDAHTGALLAELAAGHDLIAATRRATVAAALAVTKSGSATGPTRAELDEALTGLTARATGIA